MDSKKRNVSLIIQKSFEKFDEIHKSKMTSFEEGEIIRTNLTEEKDHLPQAYAKKESTATQ